MWDWERFYGMFHSGGRDLPRPEDMAKEQTEPTVTDTYGHEATTISIASENIAPEKTREPEPEPTPTWSREHKEIMVALKNIKQELDLISGLMVVLIVVVLLRGC